MNRLRGFVAVLLLAAAGLAPAAPVVVEGSAEIGSRSMEEARFWALQDAVRNAAFISDVRVHANTRIDDDGQLWENTRVEGMMRTSRVEVLEERVRDGVLKLQVEVDLVPEGQGCAASDLRKSVVVTGFPLLNYEFPELHNRAREFPRELLLHLEADGGLVGIDRSDTGLYTQPRRAPDAIDQGINADTVVAIATRERAQFVIGGVIDEIRVDDWAGRNLFGLHYRTSAKVRVTLRLFVYDGFTGALVGHYVYREGAEVNPDDTWQIRKQVAPIATPHVNQLVEPVLNRVIARAVQDVQRDLACIPFAARVLTVDNGNVFIDAGTQVGVSPGDTFTLYSEQPAIPGVVGDHRGIYPRAVVRIGGVYPNAAIAALESGALAATVRPGDIVREW